MKSGSKALVFAGLVLVNYLASQLPFRGDTTADRIYTLSSGTKSILQKIEEPVVLDFYFSKDAAGLPVSYKNYAARVQEMLRQNFNTPSTSSSSAANRSSSPSIRRRPPRRALRRRLVLQPPRSSAFARRSPHRPARPPDLRRRPGRPPPPH
jgi:hypothetical protein